MVLTTPPTTSSLQKNIISKITAVAILLWIGLSNCSTTKITGTATGNLSPEIVAENGLGVSVPLSDLRGSYVLIAFWESGNESARKNHFEIQRLYNKHKESEFENGEGFHIYSVSLDSDKQKWMEAVKEDDIAWPCNLIDTRSWNAEAALKYNIAYLPKYYLIDGNGVIVNKNILIEDLEDILTKNLSGKYSSR